MKNAKNPLGSWEKTIKALEVDTVSDEMITSLRNMITLDTFANLIPTIQSKIAEIDQYKVEQKKRQDGMWSDLQQKLKNEIDRIGQSGSIVFIDTTNGTPSKSPYTNMTSTEDKSKSSFFIIDDYRVPHAGPNFWADNPPMKDKERSAFIFPSTIPSDAEIQTEYELFLLESFLLGAKIQIEMPDELPQGI